MSLVFNKQVDANAPNNKNDTSERPTVCDVCRDVVAENGFTLWVTEEIETVTEQGATLGL